MPTETLTVRAREGIKVPMEGAPRRYIQADPVTVPASPYYRRQIRHGDLIEVQAAAPLPAPKKEK